MFKQLLLIALGGAVGSVFRYLISLIDFKSQSTYFPYATLITNLIGCLFIGIIIGFFERNQLLSQNLKLFLVVGFCGGFTTFSSFALEGLQLYNNGNLHLSLLYISLSVTLGLLFVLIGHTLTIHT